MTKESIISRTALKIKVDYDVTFPAAASYIPHTLSNLETSRLTPIRLYKVTTLIWQTEHIPQNHGKGLYTPMGNPRHRWNCTE